MPAQSRYLSKPPTSRGFALQSVKDVMRLYTLVRAASRLVSTLSFGNGINSKASVELRLDAARTSARATFALEISEMKRLAHNSQVSKSEPYQSRAVQCVSPIQDNPRPHPPRHRFPIQLPILLPFGHQHQRIRIVRHLLGCGATNHREVAMLLLKAIERYRIVHLHLAAPL